VSHQPQRTETDCLNCGATVQERYCGVCGQENVVTKQNFWSLATHFIFDIFHFDGKFFDTLRHLLIRPGKVPKEYVAGRRMSYLDPIRMYLFTSALFFLVFFSTNAMSGGDNHFSGRMSRPERMKAAMEIKGRQKAGRADAFDAGALDVLLDSTMRVYALGVLPGNDSVVRINGKVHRLKADHETTQRELDSTLQSKSWFRRQLLKKITTVEKRYDNDEDATRTILDHFMHRVPYALFASLPFFALVLHLLYAGRKRFYYHDHIVFTLYHYIFSFLLMLVILGLTALANWLDWGIFAWLIAGLCIWWNIYLYKGLKVFYGQGRGKTILKFILLNMIGFVVINILFFLFVLLTAFQL
jgi:hypothetical protein